MRVDLFDFDLPADRIAVRPAEPRDHARLLVVRPGESDPFDDGAILDLPGLLRPGDVLVVNDTRVIPARLQGVRTRGADRARIEATLHKREGEARWRAFVRPAKKLKQGEIVRFSDAPGLAAAVAEKGEAGEVLLAFDLSGAALDAAIERIGQMPLPPYIAARRPADGRDALDYQTLFAQRAGAVAAPTAGLHFTPGLVAALKARGLLIQTVTLHVGAGTFLPVKADETGDHKMHAEWGEVSAATADALNRARASGGRIVAVGTTSLRILESAAGDDGVIAPFADDTSIFITPGYVFKAVGALLTNFHLPRSTLFMLVSAFCGLETMQAAYSHAIASDYRFYSYGDACLLFPAQSA
ncbi:tRNA preQ1(34) S-adenosylmethionine ribosyltransferase-isomerase QueA [Methylocapsa palsarum]|uniref:S-adenosylmethionine:tRNA ribosyltransferase-isomerase n=1 Tax=Methylocapsa palsarum TaxID=1612308 RepID=A0A1I4C4U8_9HYPH|nr:tRNA preQ1(34) S-adenosylmethionine ribosyltransferase-isomerase QueA [Methylocapsa palsarum]SFK76144.1 S-adenosylmethionine:tRNA ribosyltransferase-isomerase [Methylocapsa palsarum]